MRDSFNRANQGSVQSFHLKKIGAFPGKVIITRESGSFGNIRIVTYKNAIKYLKYYKIFKIFLNILSCNYNKIYKTVDSGFCFFC